LRVSTHNEFLLKLVKIHGNKYEVLGTYKDSRTKIKIRCSICSNEWMANPRPLYKGIGCPECGKVKARETIKYNITQEQFLSKIPNTLRNSIKVLDTYKNVTSPIRVECLVCKRVWVSRAVNLYNGQGCSDCARARKGKASRKTHNLYSQQIHHQYEGAIELLSQYIAGKDLITFKCTNCDYVGSKEAQRLLSRGCPECFGSIGERKVAALLDSLGIDYTQQFWFKDLRGKSNPLRFDFAIFNNGSLLGLIEYDGSQHFRPFFLDKDNKRFNEQQKYDRLKNQYCAKRKIPLIRIPYYNYKLLTESYLKEIIWKKTKLSRS